MRIVEHSVFICRLIWISTKRLRRAQQVESSCAKPAGKIPLRYGVLHNRSNAYSTVHINNYQ